MRFSYISTAPYLPLGGTRAQRGARRYALAAFGVANKANYPVVGDIGFSEAWSHEDWKGYGKWNEHVRYWNDRNGGKFGVYRGIDNATINRANENFAALLALYTNAKSSVAGGIISELRQVLGTLCDDVDSITLRHVLVNYYSDPDHAARVRALNAVNAAIDAFVSKSNIAIPEIQKAIKAAQDQADKEEKDRIRIKSEEDAKIQQAKDQAAKDAAAADQLEREALEAEEAAKKAALAKINEQRRQEGKPPLKDTGSGGEGQSVAEDKPALPLTIILPIGGALVIAALLLLMPKKRSVAAPTPAVAGYRSRRRRRRR